MNLVYNAPSQYFISEPIVINIDKKTGDPNTVSYIGQESAPIMQLGQSREVVGQTGEASRLCVPEVLGCMSWVQNVIYSVL